MTSQSTLSLDLREFRVEDYDRLVELNNANYPDSAVSISEQRARDESINASNYLLKRWTCLDPSGRIVGFGNIRHVTDTFHPKKFAINVLVDPTTQGKGVGSAIYRRLDLELASLGAITAWAFCKEDLPVLREFYRRRGFHETSWDWVSRLELGTFVITRFQGYIDKAARAGISFTTLADEQRNTVADSLKKIHELTELVMADAPRQAAFTPRNYEQWKAFELDTPRLAPEGWFIAKHGQQYIGLSNVFKNEKDPLVLSTGDTGVRREYRGRGIATVLKVKVIEYAKKNGYEQLETWNDSTNAAMLAVNTKLGFKRKIGWVRMEKLLSK